MPSLPSTPFAAGAAIAAAAAHVDTDTNCYRRHSLLLLHLLSNIAAAISARVAIAAVTAFNAISARAAIAAATAGN